MDKILVIDDEPIITDLIKESIPLFYPQMQVLITSDPYQGYNFAQEVMPDVILLDIYMPGIGGFELCKMLKENPLTAHIPIILMTGKATDRKLKTKSLDIGADAFLTKPFDLPELAAQIKAMLRMKKAEEEVKKERDQLKDTVKIQSEKLDENELRWQLILQSTNEGIWDWNLRTSDLFVSQRWKDALGYDDTFNSKVLSMFNLVHPEDNQRFKDTLIAYLQRKIPKFHLEVRMKCANGQYKWMDFRGQAIWDKTGTALRMIGIQADITEKKNLEERLQKMAHHDALTGLPNRTLFADRAAQFLANAQRNSLMLAIMYIDLDGFKQVNDTLGHNIGDLLLIQVARRLLHSVRANDTVARIGGDEFLMMLSDLRTEDEALIVAERALEELSSIFVLEEHDVHISCSIGISYYPLHGSNINDLIKRADIALYSAKESGKNRYHRYDATMSEKDEIKTIQQDIFSEGLAKEDFQLYYQPIFNSHGEIEAVEALIRWNHPVHGLTAPNQFLHIAEETGFVLELGKWIIEHVAKDIQLVQKQVRFHVNISRTEFLNDDFITFCAHFMTKQRSLAGKLIFELPENALNENFERAERVIEQLHNLGIDFCLDNVGIGYISLQFLSRYAIKYLKIDRVLVQGITTNEKDAAGIRSILSFAKDMKLEAIALGAETEEQLSALKELGCKYVQGYVYARPDMISKLDGLLKK